MDNTTHALLMAAIERGATAEVVAQIVSLGKDDARRAFDAALLELRTHVTTVERDGQFQEGVFKGKWHTTLEGVERALSGPLAAHGFVWRWESRDEPDFARVQCILSHKAGHSESSGWMGAPADYRDDAPDMTRVQAMAATRTQLRRQTLIAVTGVVESGGGQAQAEKRQPVIQAIRSQRTLQDVARALCSVPIAQRGAYLSDYRSARESFVPAGLRELILGRMVGLVVDPNEQGTEGWKMARCGLPTASISARLIDRQKRATAGKRVGDWSSAADKACATLAIERVTGRIAGDGFTSDAADEGHRQEPLAIAAYEATTGAACIQTGLVYMDGRPFGTSPDSLALLPDGRFALDEVKTLVSPERIADFLNSPDKLAWCVGKPLADEDYSNPPGMWNLGEFGFQVRSGQWMFTGVVDVVDLIVWIPSLGQSFWFRIERDERLLEKLGDEIRAVNERIKVFEQIFSSAKGNISVLDDMDLDAIIQGAAPALDVAAPADAPPWEPQAPEIQPKPEDPKAKPATPPSPTTKQPKAPEPLTARKPVFIPKSLF